VALVNGIQGIYIAAVNSSRFLSWKFQMLAKATSDRILQKKLLFTELANPQFVKYAVM
jgi:hypothetical protein